MGKKYPLSGIRVVELGSYVAAPALGFMLGMLGAEVIKVEPPNGDPTREVTPWSWINYNSNKMSICLDLRTNDGISIFRRIVSESDIFVEGLSRGTVEKLGIDFQTLSKVNNKIIYCSIKGYSSETSKADRPAFDTIAQAEAGLMYVTMSGENDVPRRVGNPCVDLTAALFGLAGILCSLISPRRNATYIEVPLFDVVAYWNSYWFPYLEINNSLPINLGMTHPGFSPYGVFRCKDGFIFVGVLNDKQWNFLSEKLGIDTKGFESTAKRISKREKINELIQKKVGKMKKTDLLSLISKDVPCASVNSLLDVLNDTDLKNKLTHVLHDGKTYSILMPPLVTGKKKKLRTHRKDEDMERILEKLGLKYL